MKNQLPKIRTMLFSFFLVILCSNSCFESDLPRCDWEQEFTSYQESALVFYQNVTYSNCQNFKNKALALVDKYENCDDFGIYINDVRSGVLALNCNGL